MAKRLVKYLGWAAYAGLAAVAFVVTGYFAFSLFVRSGVTAVPGVEGLPAEEAEALVRDQGLRLEWRDGEERYDDSVPEGHVVLQEPSSGSLVKRGASVEAVRSLGEQLVEVPDLRGMAFQAAQVTLSAGGLVLGNAAGVYSSGGPVGTVVEQSPLPGSHVGSSTPVEVFLSLEDPSGTYLMPDLVYRSYRDVERYFEARRLRLGSVKFETYEGIAPGVVLRQFPLPGHPLRQRDVISLVVTMPDRPRTPTASSETDA